MVRAPVHNDTKLVDELDRLRIEASSRLNPQRKIELGQFLTPGSVARLMASMFATASRDSIRLLDAGAGVGTLTAAWIDEFCSRDVRPREITVVAYEIDPTLSDYLQLTVEACRLRCERADIRVVGEIRREDFIDAGVDSLQRSMFGRDIGEFDCAIVNPPYRKIRSTSRTRALLRTIGVESTNLYSAFLAIVTRLLVNRGELVMITPRSFCNGPYFRPFRRAFLDSMSTQQIHIFDSRKSAFKDDDVLQENVIFHAVKGPQRSGRVTISSSAGPGQLAVTKRNVPYTDLVSPDDPESFIHIVPDETGTRVAEQMRALPNTLKSLGVSVSTGRVVEFRARQWISNEAVAGTVPLIFPGHLNEAMVSWPKPNGRKPNAIADCGDTSLLLVPSDYYVLVKRLSAKEERRRIVAAFYDPRQIAGERVGFENHLNYFHVDGRGLAPRVAKGLTAFLNSTLVDSYFRQFNGHTQVNANDLRRLRYPTGLQLDSLAARIGETNPNQADLDRIVEEELAEHAPIGALVQ